MSISLSDPEQPPPFSHAFIPNCVIGCQIKHCLSTEMILGKIAMICDAINESYLHYYQRQVYSMVL